MRTDLKRTIEFRPAFDRRDPDPNKNYGIGSVRVSFFLHGEAGCVQFVISTGWYPDAYRPNRTDFEPMSFGIDYHSKTPRYEGHTPMKDCRWTGGDCYCDGSSLAGDRLMKRFFVEGEEVVWSELESWYASHVEGRTDA
jgi:hypothetical protein